MRRFFSDESFWNQPIAPDARADPRSDRWIADMDAKFGPMYLNMHHFAIPVYFADGDTPRRAVHQKRPGPDVPADLLDRERRYRQHPDFGQDVPIPEGALPDPADDAHMAIVDFEQGLAWDMWRCRIRPDGEYESSTGMVYPIDGDGTFRREDFPIANGESMHFYGPSRAAGVPAIAGLILHEEIQAGVIEHKLAFACLSNGHRANTYPAIWTDGGWPDGVPEGAVVQLDPQLDLDRFPLSPAARIIARAMQVYGAVDVDGARGNVLYCQQLCAEGGRSWESLLGPDDLRCIPMTHYRVLEVGEVRPEGDDCWCARRARQRDGQGGAE